MLCRILRECAVEAMELEASVREPIDHAIGDTEPLSH
jgi:hypothetical protein